MEIDLFFIHEKLSAVQIPGPDQKADILTKPLSSALFLELHSKLNVLCTGVSG